MLHLLLLLGFGLILVGLKGMYRYFVAQRWRSASARVVSISEHWVDVPMHSKRLRYYFPKVEYEYEINGQVFTATRASFEKENIWQPEVDAWGVPNKKDEFFWAKWVSGTVIAIHVDPENPREAVIVRDLNSKRRSHHSAILFGGVLVAALWALLFYVSNH